MPSRGTKNNSHHVSIDGQAISLPRLKERNVLFHVSIAILHESHVYTNLEKCAVRVKKAPTHSWSFVENQEDDGTRDLHQWRWWTFVIGRRLAQILLILAPRSLKVVIVSSQPMQLGSYKFCISICVRHGPNYATTYADDAQNRAHLHYILTVSHQQ